MISLKRKLAVTTHDPNYALAREMGLGIEVGNYIRPPDARNQTEKAVTAMVDGFPIVFFHGHGFYYEEIPGLTATGKLIAVGFQCFFYLLEPRFFPAEIVSVGSYQI